jgi:hypothetical protein
MKKKTNVKPAPAKDVISREAAKAFDTRIEGMLGSVVERWSPFVYAIFDQRLNELDRRNDEMALATGLSAGMAQLLCALGETIAMRRSSAELLELGSSEEAMQLCAEVLARGSREPTAEAGKGHVLRFPRFRWKTLPTPVEAPPEEEDETGTITDEAGEAGDVR